MAGKNPEYEATRGEARLSEREVLVHRDRWEEVSRAKDTLRRAGEEDAFFAGEKSGRSRTGERYGRSPDTINAYRAREPRAESGESVDTINAYRSRYGTGQAGLESPYWADIEDEP